MQVSQAHSLAEAFDGGTEETLAPSILNQFGVNHPNRCDERG